MQEKKALKGESPFSHTLHRRDALHSLCQKRVDAHLVETEGSAGVSVGRRPCVLVALVVVEAGEGLVRLLHDRAARRLKRPHELLMQCHRDWAKFSGGHPSVVLVSTKPR